MEILKFTLYHGTSTLFLESIKSEGLGQTNIVLKYDLITTLKELYAVAKVNIEYWKLYGWYVEDIIGQKINGSNWQHGQVYLSPALSTAFRYARSNKYGSELVTLIVRMYNDLIIKGIKFPMKNNFILSILDKDFLPVVLKINNIQIDFLETETLDSLQSSIDLVNEFKEDESVCQQINFRLTKPINTNHFEVLSI